jgi:hypothetical protein
MASTSPPGKAFASSTERRAGFALVSRRAPSSCSTCRRISSPCEDGRALGFQSCPRRQMAGRPLGRQNRSVLDRRSRTANRHNASHRARLAALCPAALVARAWRRLGRERDADRLLFSGKVKEFCHDRPRLGDREGNRARSDLFIEYFGDYPSHGGPSHLLNSGGANRITPKQQIDFHLGAGLNRAGPSYVIGVGYSIRFDGMF